MRKTTSAAGASAIVLSAIERMESQNQGQSQPPTAATAAVSTTAAMAIPAAAATVIAPTSFLKNKNTKTDYASSTNPSIAAVPASPEPISTPQRPQELEPDVNAATTAQCEDFPRSASFAVEVPSVVPAPGREDQEGTVPPAAATGGSRAAAAGKGSAAGCDKDSTVAAEVPGKATRHPPVAVSAVSIDSSGLCVRGGGGGEDYMSLRIEEGTVSGRGQEELAGSGSGAADPGTGGEDCVDDGRCAAAGPSDVGTVAGSSSGSRGGGNMRNVDVTVVSGIPGRGKDVAASGVGNTTGASTTSTSKGSSTPQTRDVSSKDRDASTAHAHVVIPTGNTDPAPPKRARHGSKDESGDAEAGGHASIARPYAGKAKAKHGSGEGGGGKPSRLNPRAVPFTFNLPTTLVCKKATNRKGRSFKKSSSSSSTGSSEKVNPKDTELLAQKRSTCAVAVTVGTQLDTLTPEVANHVCLSADDGISTLVAPSAKRSETNNASQGALAQVPEQQSNPRSPQSPLSRGESSCVSEAAGKTSSVAAPPGVLHPCTETPITSDRTDGTSAAADVRRRHEELEETSAPAGGYATQLPVRLPVRRDGGEGARERERLGCLDISSTDSCVLRAKELTALRLPVGGGFQEGLVFLFCSLGRGALPRIVMGQKSTNDAVTSASSRVHGHTIAAILIFGRAAA